MRKLNVIIVFDNEEDKILMCKRAIQGKAKFSRWQSRKRRR